MRVKKAGIGITVDAVNCRTGATDDPAKFVLMVIEVNAIASPSAARICGKVPLYVPSTTIGTSKSFEVAAAK